MVFDKPPENPVVYTHRDFGAAYFVANLPNSYERMWMVARAINFDMSNYNKLYSNPDIASKRRYLKNIVRFLDHPPRFLFWKLLPYSQTGTIKFLPFFWFITIGGSFLISGAHHARVNAYKAYQKQHQGHIMHELPTQTFSYKKFQSMNFHEQEFNADKGAMSQKGIAPGPTFVRLNTHVRDQNFRKYFAHRERREVDPFTGKPKQNGV